MEELGKEKSSDEERGEIHMPHSGGGGSHSSGSHSSGGHSSSHSSHSYGGSHSGGTRGPRTSTSYFPGARTFVYYRNQNPVFVYSDSDLRTTSKIGKLRYLLLLFYIPFIFAIVGLALSSFHIPMSLKGTEQNQIIIEDNIDVLDHTDNLLEAMNTFKNKTGITPALITVDKSEWEPYYETLENYAYELYLNKLPDETYLLIVYSEAEHEMNSFNDWDYELMEGDDTNNILTSSVNVELNSKIYDYLLTSSRYSTSEAFEKVFVEETKIVMKKNNVWPELFMALFMSAFILFHMYFMVFFKGRKPQYKPEELKEVMTNGAKPEIGKCEYCGSAYVIGTDLNCPHCGASIMY